MFPRTLGQMVAGKKLIVTSPDATLRSACVLMAAHDVGALPVVDRQGWLVGMISERDVIKRSVIIYRNSASTKVREVMTRNPSWLPADARPRQATTRMREGGFRHMPVCNAFGVLGMVSVRDFEFCGNPILRGMNIAAGLFSGRQSRAQRWVASYH